MVSTFSAFYAFRLQSKKSLTSFGISPLELCNPSAWWENATKWVYSFEELLQGWGEKNKRKFFSSLNKEKNLHRFQKNLQNRKKIDQNHQKNYRTEKNLTKIIKKITEQKKNWPKSQKNLQNRRKINQNHQKNHRTEKILTKIIKKPTEQKKIWPKSSKNLQNTLKFHQNDEKSSKFSKDSAKMMKSALSFSVLGGKWGKQSDFFFFTPQDSAIPSFLPSDWPWSLFCGGRAWNTQCP